MDCRNITFAWPSVDRRYVADELERLTGLPWRDSKIYGRFSECFIAPSKSNELTMDRISALVAEKHPDLRGKDLSGLFGFSRWFEYVWFVENDNNIATLKRLLEESRARKQLVQELIEDRLVLTEEASGGSPDLEAQQCLEGVLGLGPDLQGELLAML
jgi:hypothetical protein